MQSDEALARAIQQGNQAALTSLVERYYTPLLGYLFRLSGGQQSLAEDLLQETFLRMMRGIVAYDAQRPFKPWLYAIATNISRNHFKRADTRYTQNPDEDSDYADETASQEERLLAEESQAAVLSALATLPEHQREVVILFYYQDLAQKEIAEILQIPVGTVKSRLSLGLRRLRAVLEECL